MKTILITGGTGLIGKVLTPFLQREGFEVTHLSRKKNSGGVKTYVWDTAANQIDHSAVADADYIIHLAGANVADHRWTAKYKREIVESRTKSASLLYKALEKTPNQVKAIVSASAIGYYGDRGEEWLREEAAPANDFLGTTCRQWEASVHKFVQLNKRVAILRTGIVLAKEGGALPPLVQPIRYGIAPIFGNGQQYYPWIHIEDVCRMYLHAITNETMKGAYNAVGNEPERYINLMNAIAKTIGRKKINVPVPMPVLQIAMGDFVKTLSMSSRCSSDKIKASGFTFRFPELKTALHDLLN
ncbi:MAG TPA: TIGR01777 family oxidoreductase [Chitinophagales bacterium]|nr:TIGR01777 family oxidoreductase [Chitinophagales bacterium]